MNAKVKKQRQKVMLITIVLIAGFLYASVTLISQQVKMASLKEAYAEAEAQYEDEKLRQIELEELQKVYETDAFKEKSARDMLGLVAPGERVFIDSSKQ